MKIILFANTDWYLYNFRLPLAKFLRNQSHEVIFVSPPGSYTGKLTNEGFRWVSLNMDRRSVNPFSEILAIISLIKILNNERPDLIHNFTIKSVIYGSIAARFTRTKRIVNAVAGLGFIFTNKSTLASILRPIVKLILKTSLNGEGARLILQNPDDKELFLRSNLICKSKIRLIKGSGVNTGLFVPNPDKQSDVINVLLASRLLWDKGISDYVEAARIVKVKYPDVNFLLAGVPDFGNPNSVQESDLNNWRNEGVIQPIGHVDAMPKRLSDVNIVVLPTVYGEGVPRILIEAASAGIPIIATDVPGCREIINNNVNGYLIQPKQPQQLAQSLMLLISDSDLSKNMGMSGRKIVLDEFEESSVLKRTLEVYDEALA